MKIIILPIILAISFLLFLPQKTYSQSGPECMKIFDKEMKDCTTEYNACSDACMKESEKPDGTAYFNAGEIYPKCIKASQCHEKSSSCSEQVLTNYKACGKPDRQSEAAEAKKEDNLKMPDLSPESLEQLNSDFWTSIKFKEKVQSVGSWIDQNIGVYESVVTPKSMEREPQIKQGQPSSEAEARRVTESHLIPGAVIKNYQKGVMIEISQGGWVYIDPSGEVNYGTDRWRNYFDILMGTVEVETEKNAIDAKTPNTNVKSKGTHYWVYYDPKKKETTVGVYEGEVEVQSKDGKTTTVSSSNGRPGVVVVSQKLSVIKLAISGVILLTVTGAIVFLLKKRGLKVLSSKKSSR